MAIPSSEQRELELVEKVDLRILNVANNESKLQQLLQVLTVAQRLKTFIQPPGIVLPVSALVDQFKNTDAPVLRQLDMIFIQHSLGRLGVTERRQLIPKVLLGIGKRPDDISNPHIFNVFLRLLPDLRLPARGSKEDSSFREDVGLSNSQDAKFVAGWLGKLLLLRLIGPRPDRSTLSIGEVSFLTLDRPSTWNPTDTVGLALPDIRIKATNFLASGAFIDEERFLPAIFAAASTDGRISSLGDELLKRSTVSLEKPELIERLFEAHSTLPAPYRTRILSLLSRSSLSATYADQILAVVRRDMDRGDAVDSVQDLPSNTSSAAAGLETTKLRKALFEYITWIARVGPGKTDFNKIGLPLMTQLRQFVEEQGWPVSEKQSRDDVFLRESAYGTIGVLAKGTKMDDSDKLSVVGWLFRSLTEDTLPDVVVNVDGALSSLTILFQPQVAGKSNPQLRTLLLAYMTTSEEGNVVRSARHAAAKWVNECLPFGDVQARWIDILAIAGRRGERSDVVEEGRKGLDPWTYRVNSDQKPILPDWAEMVRTFFKEPITSFNPSEWMFGRGTSPDNFSVFTNFQSDSLQAYPLAIEYCKQILFLTALPDFQIEPGWAAQLQNQVHSNKSSRDLIRNYLFSVNGQALFHLLDAAFQGMLRDNTEVAEPCATVFVDIASLAPSLVVGRLAARAMELLPLVKSNRREIRHLGAKAFGILAAHPLNSNDSIANYVSTLGASMKTWVDATGSELNAAEGAFLAFGHLLSRRVYYLGRGSALGVNESREQLLPSPTVTSEKSTKSAQEAIFETFTQLWTAGIWQFRDLGSSESRSYAETFVSTLTASSKSGNEKAAIALGRLAIALDANTVFADAAGSKWSNDLVDSILARLYELHELKNVEIQLTIGEAITATIAGWDSDVVQLTLDVVSGATDYCAPHQTARLEETLKKVLEDCKSTKPSLLKASGIWLFCIIQNCSHLPEVQAKLRECQAAFMRLLSARDTLVQETASRGLTLVYEKGDVSLRGDLVKDLVSTFTGSGPQLKVEEDTELFDAGALPTGEGNSVTSYRDIVKLANEVGDQSLIYKFMSLASNAAAWNTRSAFGRFGLSSILSESEVDPKLYPKLYRYRFDPNTGVQQSMNDIWKALVKNPNAVLETYFDAIMRDLLKSILGKEWRVREASCAAISELIQGRPFLKYEMYYKDIWTAALKVLDDVKATVRNAALNLCVTLSNTLVRLLEESGTSAATAAMMKEALPFLLSEKGIESSVEDVKLFATVTVLKIAKAGGPALKPYIATMIPHLLGLLSTIEPDALNYHYQRAGEDRKEKIDKLRSAMVNRSPITEAIENALRSADSATMSALATGIETAAISALGMPTKLGCARVLTTLATRHGHDFAPHAARFLKLMEKLILDRNDEVSQAYAAAAAYTVRAAPSDAQLRYADKLVELYLSAEDEHRRQKVADAALALSKLSPDHFAALEARLLPLAYLARHDDDEYVSKALAEVWAKHAGGSARSVARFADEITALAAKALAAPQWTLKHAGALTAAGLVASLTEGTSAVNVLALRKAWPVYEKALALKTFPRKEKLLEAFPDFVAHGKQLWEGDAPLAAMLHKIAVREAKRNNEAYRPHAFRCLWRFARARDDLDLRKEIVGIVTPYLEELRDREGRMDVDGGGDGPKGRGGKGKEEDLLAKTAESAVDAVARGYSTANMRANPGAALAGVIQLLKPFLLQREFDGIRRAVWYKCVADIMDDASKAASQTRDSRETTSGVAETDVALAYVSTLDLAAAAESGAGTEGQRTARSKAVLSVARAAKNGVFTQPAVLQTELREAIGRVVAAERSADVQKVWREALGEL